MTHDALSCASAREQLSARLDGECARADALRAHLLACGACRAHERALASLAHGFEALREPETLPDLWPRIERRLQPGSSRSNPSAPWLTRAAAALLGFASLGGAALWLERERAPAPAGRHLFERLAPDAGPAALFANLPEYRILRAFPSEDER
jgi:anti-sigma factor RsiW